MSFKKIFGTLIVFVGIGVLVAVVLIKLTEVPARKQAVVPEPQKAPLPAPVQKKSKPDKVVRKTVMDPNRRFEISTLYGDGEKIASFKSSGEKIFDLVGSIPDGKVEFQNFTTKTKGEEHWKDNKRHGWYREYYDNGTIKKETRYFYGEKKGNMEYYYDGTLRMEEDLSDALQISQDTEKGVGAVYLRNGRLMYEWKITSADQNRYKKSYNQKGVLVEEKRYDQFGELVEVIDYRKR